MTPGAGALPPAERTVPVVERMDAQARTLSPRIARGMKLGLLVFEWLPFPWRFSRASLAQRRVFLERLARSRVPLLGDLLLMMKTLTLAAYGTDERVQRAVGFSARCEVTGEQPPEPVADAPLGDLDPAGEGEDCDVAIVGSGAGGAVAATVLAEAGLDVLVLEAGPYLDRRSYPDDPLEALQTMYRDGGLTITEGRPMVPVPIGRVVGGTTVINSGTCFRAPERALRNWRDQHAIAWATELDGAYEAAERELHVRPVDESRMGRNGQLVAEGAAAIGASGGPLSRNAGRCVQCSSCPDGCRLDAKRAMHVSYLPRAVAAGARVRAGVEADAIEFERGRATGVRCRVTGPPRPGEQTRPRQWRVRARRAVISAAGAFGTPELLLRSGVRHRALGRNLRIHPAAWIGARFDEPVRGWEGVMQSYYVDEWQARGLVMEATFTPLAFGSQWLPGVGADHSRRLLEFDRVGSNGVHLSDTTAGRVGLARDGSLRVGYRLNKLDAERLSFGIARAAEIWFAAGATEVYPQVAGNPILGPNDVASFEASRPSASRLRLEAFHPLGSARMSADPDAGPTTPRGAVRGREALYVADASLFPSSLGVNPMMTVIACATKVAEQLTARLD